MKTQNFIEIETFCSLQAQKVYKTQYGERKILRAHALWQLLKIAAIDGADAKSVFAPLPSSEIVLRIWGEGAPIEIDSVTAGIVLNRWAREVFYLELNLLVEIGHSIKSGIELLFVKYGFDEDIDIETLYRGFYRFRKNNK